MNDDRPILSNVPDTSRHALQQDDLFVILGCDGVWDVLTDQQAVDLALEHWPDPSAASAAIVRKALSSGSGDNLTAQVVSFGEWKRERGAEVAAQRAAAAEAEARMVREPSTRPKVEEDEVDMFA